MALRSLSDSPVLAPLARAAEQAGVDVVLFGSVATRAMLFDAAKVEPRDLFELAEHAADIDLAHTGPASVTPRLQAAIADVVPMAPWFRWSIIDRDGLATLEKLRPFNIGVPLRQLRLWSLARDSVDATAELLVRALDGKVDIVGNEAFGSSPRSGHDTEASAVLLYIDTTLDVFEAQRRSGQRMRVMPDPHATQLLAAGVARLATLSADGRTAALRRLWYRLAAAGVRMSPQLFREARDVFDLAPLLNAMQQAAYPAESFGGDEDTPVMLSAYLGNGVFRIPFVTDGDGGFGERRGWLDQALDEVSGHLLSDVAAPEPISLGVGNEVIAAMRSIPLHQGESPSSISKGRLAQEFIYIGLPARRGELGDTSADRLTAIVIGHGPEGPSLLPAFSSVSTALPSGPFGLRSERCTIRVNIAGMNNGFEKLDIFLVKGNWE